MLTFKATQPFIRYVLSTNEPETVLHMTGNITEKEKMPAIALLTFCFEETGDKSNTKQGHQLNIRKMENVLLDF